jgi:flagellar basal body-associated protein FliL
MKMYANVKGFSTITLILLIIVSAIIGGLISYAFTIAYYAKIPEKTTLTITGVYINKENVRSFNVSVLNPSYSPSDAKISRIAISLKGETQLYNVVETEPSIGDGLTISRGEALNITCLTITKDNVPMSFGEFVSVFAGKTIIVHVFAEGSPAANMEAVLPLVKLDIVTDFNPKISFKKFNITLTNSLQSEVDLTVVDIIPGVITVEKINPDVRAQPVAIPRNESKLFIFNGDWHGITSIKLEVKTEQGYVFYRNVEMKTADATIKNVSFSEDHPDHFNVTVYNFPGSANPVNVTRIECRLENGTALTFDCGSVGIAPNSTRTFRFDWNWTEYRGKNVTVIAYFTQDFEAQTAVKTLPPIIVKILDAENTFNLKDHRYFNITILNHFSSLEDINVTKIRINETGVILRIEDGFIARGFNKTFSCTFNWGSFLKERLNRSLTLTLNVTSCKTFRNYTFNFTFTLPVAELNVTAVNCTTIGGANYLNLTVRSADYSVWNLTLSKVVVTVQDMADPLEYVIPRNQVIVNVGEEITVLCPFDWQKYQGKKITITVFTAELIEASTSYTIP